MSTAEIIEGAFNDGVTLTMTSQGTVKVRGNGPALNKWAPVLKQHKPDIVAALQEFENLLARVGPLFQTPKHEYDEIRIAAMRDLDSTLQSYRLMAKNIDARRIDDAMVEERHQCKECANLTQRGRCMAAQRGEIDHVSFFEPVADVLRRCAGFNPKAGSIKRESE